MSNLRLVFIALLLVLNTVSAPLVSAHQLNPKVIKQLTGEQIEYHEHDREREVADPRNKSRTFYSFLEWYIVYSAEEYAEFVTAGNMPSQFPYFKSIAQFWEAWEDTEFAAGLPPDATTNTVLWTIAVSFTVESALIGLYEVTVGKVSELLNFNQKTIEDQYIDAKAKVYADFLNQTPWYEFPYVKTLGGLWQTYDWSSLTPRGIERRVAYTIGYGGKAIYASVIKKLSEVNFEGGAGQTTVVTVETTKAVIQSLDLDYPVVTSSDQVYQVTLPRYRAFLEPTVKLAGAGAVFQSVEGHKQIALSVLVPIATTCAAVTENYVFTLPLVTDGTTARWVLAVQVSKLADVIIQLRDCNLTVEHIYDY